MPPVEVCRLMTYSRSSRSLPLGVGNLLHSIGISLSNSVCLRPSIRSVAPRGQQGPNQSFALYSVHPDSSIRNWRMSHPAECRAALLRWAQSWDVRIGLRRRIWSVRAIPPARQFIDDEVEQFMPKRRWPLHISAESAKLGGVYGYVCQHEDGLQNPCARRSANVSSASRNATERSQ